MLDPKQGPSIEFVQPPHKTQLVTSHFFTSKLCTAVMYSVPYKNVRPISTPRLNALLRVHLVPINLIISQGT